jgi:hypothetical protein
MEKGSCNKVIDQEYFHIGNGGVTFKIIDSSHGPEVRVEISTHGNTSEIRSYFSAEDLLKISKLFKNASEFQFSKDTYCCAARSLKDDCCDNGILDD